MGIGIVGNAEKTGRDGEDCDLVAIDAVSVDHQEGMNKV